MFCQENVSIDWWLDWAFEPRRRSGFPAAVEFNIHFAGPHRSLAKIKQARDVACFRAVIPMSHHDRTADVATVDGIFCFPARGTAVTTVTQSAGAARVVGRDSR